LISSGLIAGTFFYGTFSVLPAFYAVSPQIHLEFRTALMNGNRLMVMGLIIFGILAMGWYTWEARYIRLTRTFCFCALALTLFSLIITRVGSVPINLQIKTWNSLAPPQAWLAILERWNFYNALRTTASFLSFACLLAADYGLKKFISKT